MSIIYCKTQTELEAALAQHADDIRLSGDGYFEVRAYDSSTVTAYGSSTVTAYGSSTVRACDSSTVTAYGSSTVRACDSSTVRACGSSTVRACDSSTVTAYGSSTVRACDSSTVTAYGSSTVRACDSSTVRACGSSTVRAYDSSTVRACDSSTVTAYGSSTVRACDSSTVRACDSSTVTAYGSSTVRACDSSTVRACGSSTVRAYDSSTVRASKFVPVSIHGQKAKVAGGVQIKIPTLKTVSDWCAFHGIKVVRGVAVVFKGVGDDYQSERGASYKPGEKPEALDWQTDRKCGHGLHFSPHPVGTLRYAPNAKRWLACPVRLEEAVLIDDEPFDKIKARRVVGKGCAEVNIDGSPLEPK